MYKQDLILSNLKRLIFYNTQASNELEEAENQCFIAEYCRGYMGSKLIYSLICKLSQIFCGSEKRFFQ